MLAASPRTVSDPRAVLGEPGLASSALRPLLTSTPRAGTVLGASSSAIWCSVDDSVIVIVDANSVRLPIGIVVPLGLRPFRPGEAIRFGSGLAIGPGVAWRIVRWWDPTVRPIETDSATVFRSVDLLGQAVNESRCGDLATALCSGDADLVVDSAVAMLGAGAGLTPEGDDRLVGAIAAFRHVSASLGAPERNRVLDEVAGRLEHAARLRTTSLSAALLRHALVGDVATPVARLLRAVTGCGDLDAALVECLAVGSSSGPALVDGVLCGAGAACEAAT